jgi:hypothetical protein
MDSTTRVLFPAGARELPLRYSDYTGSGTHPASYTMGTGGSFPAANAAGA